MDIQRDSGKEKRGCRQRVIELGDIGREKMRPTEGGE